MARPLISSKGNFKATIGRKKDGTFSVSTYMAGFAEYPDLQIFLQDGLASLDAAKAWASQDLENSELEVAA